MAVAVEPDARLKAFYERVERQSLRPLWLNTSVNASEPTGEVLPWLWPWKQMRANMYEACEVMPVGRDGADRRVLTMRNPTLPASNHGSSRTLLAAMQLVKPGEQAPSHRHTMAALRYIIEGQGGYTIVNGQPLTMEPGDFVLTPSWCWHGHAHEGPENMVWMDVLDVPLVRGLNWQFYEEYSEPKTLQPADKPRDDSLRRFGTGSLLPHWMGRQDAPYSPLFAYKFPATKEALYRLTDYSASPTEGYALTFSNPFTGGPVMPTISASMHLLTAGLHTQAKRNMTNTLYHVAQGRGHSVLNGQRFDWEQDDTFVVPTWCWQEHAADGGDAILFAASDAPVLQALALYREETYATDGGHQPATSTFTPAS